MIRNSLVGLAFVASVTLVPVASAQNPTVSDSGFTATNSIMRVTRYRWVDGQMQAGQADMRTHLIPVWEAQKAAGVIVGYSVINNTGQSSPEDWQFGIPSRPPTA